MRWGGTTLNLVRLDINVIFYSSLAWQLHEGKVDHDAFSRTSASSTTTFFFLCRYLNSSSNYIIMSVVRTCRMKTYGSNKLGPYIGHVLVQGSHKPRIVR